MEKRLQIDVIHDVFLRNFKSRFYEIAHVIFGNVGQLYRVFQFS